MYSFWKSSNSTKVCSSGHNSFSSYKHINFNNSHSPAKRGIVWKNLHHNCYTPHDHRIMNSNRLLLLIDNSKLEIPAVSTLQFAEYFCTQHLSQSLFVTKLFPENIEKFQFINSQRVKRYQTSSTAQINDTTEWPPFIAFQYWFQSSSSTINCNCSSADFCSYRSIIIAVKF